MRADLLEELGLGSRTCRVTPVGGGDIHQSYRVESPGGQLLFVKTNTEPLAGIFEKEARGLEALRTAAQGDGDLLRVPRVLQVSSSFLALEWIRVSPNPSKQSGHRLGEGLAALHRHSSPHFGWSEDNWIGRLPQANSPVGDEGDGARFFALRRLQAQAELGLEKLPGSLLERIDRFCGRIGDFLPVEQEVPALVHGDLWGGNWTEDSEGLPWIFDPAVHFGCREAELAFTRLFGGFPPDFYEAYEACSPLLPGFDERMDLWNLYPLLAHANMFGGGYAGRAESILMRCVG